MGNLVQTTILNFKMAAKNTVFFVLFRSPRLKRLDFGLYTYILRVKEFNENNKNALGKLVQTTILNFKMAAKNTFFRLISVSETQET